MNFRIQTSNHWIDVVIFNRAYLKKNLKPGTEVIVFGKWKPKKNQIVASQLQFGRLEKEYVESIYHLTTKITNKKMTQWIDEALKLAKPRTSFIPRKLEEKYHFPTKEASVLEIHHPTSTVTLKKARTRLKYKKNYLVFIK